MITDTLVVGTGLIDGTGNIGSKGDKGKSPKGWDNRGTNCNHDDWVKSGTVAAYDQGLKGEIGKTGYKGASIKIFYKVLIGNTLSFKTIVDGGKGGPGGDGGDGRNLCCCHCGQCKNAPFQGPIGDEGKKGPSGTSLIRPYSGFAEIQPLLND